MLLRVVRSFLPHQQPWITRQSYAHELVTAMTLPLAISLAEGGVIGILAKKAFNVSPFLFATIMASPAFANVTSFFWARLARGRRKVRFIAALQLLTLASIALIAALPTDGAGPVLLTAMVLATRCLVSGIVTLRSTVWRHNYPRRIRARVTGRLALVTSLVIAIAPLLAYAVVDHWPSAFRVVYPVAALVASIGAVAFARVRLRRERELLRYEQDGLESAFGPTDENGFEGQPGVLSVLRHDHFFRRYLTLQFCLGTSMMMGEAVLVYLIVQMTAELRHDYLISILLTTAIPMLVATSTLWMWARHLDRVHVAGYRARHSAVCSLAHLITWVGLMRGSLWIIAMGRVLIGVTRGGGMLAWTLGHNDFADRRLVALYMGIHVTLTGVRGAIAPFLGMVLLRGWEGAPMGWLGVPAFDGIGHHVFLVAVVVSASTTVGFVALNRAVEGGKSEYRNPKSDGFGSGDSR